MNFKQISFLILLSCSYSLAMPQQGIALWNATDPVAAVEGVVQEGTHALNSWWESLDNKQKEKAQNLTKIAWSLIHNDEPVPESSESADDQTKRLKKLVKVVSNFLIGPLDRSLSGFLEDVESIYYKPTGTTKPAGETAKPILTTPAP